MIGLSHGWFKPITKKLVVVASPLSTQHLGVWLKNVWLGIGIMCLDGTTCLPACVVSIEKSNWACCGHQHYLIERKITHLVLNINHSLTQLSDIYIFDIVESGLRNHMYFSNQNKSEFYFNVLWKENLYIIYQ